MAFDRFNDKPARREKRDGDRFSGKGGRFEEFGRGRAKVASVIAATIVSAPANRLPGVRSRKSSAVVPALAPRWWISAVSPIERVCAERNGSSGFGCGSLLQVVEDVNVALRMVIALTKTVKTEETPAKVEEVQSQAIETVAETDNSEE